jgi:hypothetical protein
VRRQPTVGELLAAAKADPPAALPAARWVLEKYLDQRWVEVAVDEEAQLSKTEAQLWLALYNLLLDPAVRDIYEFTRHRADAVSALKGRFTEPVLDQLPLLGDLRRLVEEVSIALPPQQPARYDTHTHAHALILVNPDHLTSPPSLSPQRACHRGAGA